MSESAASDSSTEVTPPEGTRAPDTKPPAPAPLPAKPDGFRRLKLYAPIWRGDPGDSFRGDIVGAQPNELPDGSERMCVMVQLASSATCALFDEKPDRFEVLEPVPKVTPTTSQIVAIAIAGPALARLLAYADQPNCQRVQVHAIEPVDGAKGIANPLTGKRVRYLVFIAEKLTPRIEVDPSEIANLEEQRRAAATAT